MHAAAVHRERSCGSPTPSRPSCFSCSQTSTLPRATRASLALWWRKVCREGGRGGRGGMGCGGRASRWGREEGVQRYLYAFEVCVLGRKSTPLGRKSEAERQGKIIVVHAYFVVGQGEHCSRYAASLPPSLLFLCWCCCCWFLVHRCVYVPCMTYHPVVTKPRHKKCAQKIKTRHKKSCALTLKRHPQATGAFI